MTLPPLLAQRLGGQAAQAIAVRQRLAAAGLSLPPWIDQRPGRLQVVIGDCCDPPLGRSAAALALWHGEALLRGLGALVLATAAPRAVLAVQEREALARLRTQARGTRVEVIEVPPAWPAQPDLDVAGAWGRAWVVPAARLDADCAAVFQGQRHRLCTVAGAVGQPQVIVLPEDEAARTPRELVRRCGGATTPAWVALAGGAPGGRVWDADTPLGHDEALLLCLPVDHEAVGRLRRPVDEWLWRAAAVCQGCSLCTQGCPVRLRGVPLSPHPQAGLSTDLARACVGCGACDVLCPHDLSPSRLVAERAGTVPCGALPLPAAGADRADAAARRIPLSLLMARLGLDGFPLASL